MLHIEYQLSEDDFVAAARLMLRKRRQSRIYWAIYQVLGVVWIGLSIQAFVSHEPIWAAVLIFCAIYLLSFSFRRVYSLRKQYRKTPSLGLPTCLEIDDAEIHSMAPDEDLRSSWSRYIAFAEDDGSIVMIQQGSLQFLPIPKRQLSPVQIDALHAILAAHLPRK